MSPAEIAHGKGFYDYAHGTEYSVENHPDSTFARLEREFPMRREEMIAGRFENWEGHKDFLLEFMQMIRARSPLAMKQQEVEVRTTEVATVLRVDHQAKTMTVGPVRRPAEHEVRNLTIAKMLEQVRAGASWMSDFDWCLQFTEDEKDPFGTTDQALFVTGSLKDQLVTMELLSHPATLLIFPLCWRACLFGGKGRFDKSYDRADARDLKKLRDDQKQNAGRFVIAPMPY